jgi:hypothetical protein
MTENMKDPVHSVQEGTLLRPALTGSSGIKIEAVCLAYSDRAQHMSIE